MEVSDIILEQLASSHAVLTDDEKELGVCLIDIGGGTTDIAIFYQGAIQYTAVIPIAGDQVTNDIAMALRTPTKSAESIKLTHGCAIPEYVNASQTIDVMSVNERTGRKISTKVLADVILARYEELFNLVKNELRRSGYENLLAAGIVLTGGASKVKGAMDLAESCFELPVRLGSVQQIAGLSEVIDNPSLSTGVGLIMHGAQQKFESMIGASSGVGQGAMGVWNRMRQWFTVNF